MTETRSDSMAPRPPGDDRLGAKAMRTRIATRLFGDDGAPAKLGRFEIMESIGAGGMGVVYRGFDPDLGREVALKLLRAGDSRRDIDRLRLIREGQSLAKLNHPNVVHVYEVGEHHGDVYIAMELVEGQSLRDLQYEGPRPWVETVGLYLQAARGLAAAHSRGIVHRDFKPANVLVGLDQRVRVVDFGLARGPTGSSSGASEGSSEPANPSGSSSAGSEVRTVTQAGAVLGTPAYMAPEQMSGLPVDAASDQYSLSVSLWESLAGARPFEPVRLEPETLGTDPRPAPNEPQPIPARVRRVLLRGLSMRRADRFPDVEAWIDAVEGAAKWHGGASRRWLGLAGLTGAGAFVLLLAASAGDTAESCTAAAARIDDVWSDASASTVRAAFERTGSAAASATAGRVVARIDAYAANWRDEQVATCRALQSNARAERARASWQEACLGEARDELLEVVREMSIGDLNTVAHADAILAELKSPVACRDAGEQYASELAAQVRLAASKARIASAAGHFEDATRNADGSVDAALQTRSQSLRCEAHLVAGEVQARERNWAAADQQLENALVAAARGDAPRCQFDALLLASRVGSARDESPRAERLLRRARVLVPRLPAAVDRSAELAEARGLAKGAADDASAAVYFLRDAIDGYSERGATAREATAWMRLGNALDNDGRADEAGRVLQATYERYVELFGPEHPEAATALHNLGAHESVHDPAKAVELLDRALTITIGHYGLDHLTVSETRLELALAAKRLGDYERTIKEATAARAIAGARLGFDHGQAIEPLKLIGWANQSMGNGAAAATAYEELRDALSIERCSDLSLYLALNVAEGRSIAGELDRADQELDFVADCLREGAEGSDPIRGVLLLGRGRAAFARGDFDIARVALEAARPLLAHPDAHPLNLAQAIELLRRVERSTSHPSTPR